VNNVKEEKNYEQGIYITDAEQVSETVIETPEEVIESQECDNDIFYENEVTVMETNADNGSEYIVYENTDAELIQNIGNNISYCIEYEDGNESNGQTNESFILLENLENLPVQIKATELATVNIVPEDVNLESPTIGEDMDMNHDNHVVTSIIENKLEIINDTGNILENGDVYEVIETNNKKIFPDKDFVRKVILNKDTDVKTTHHQQTHRKRGRPRKIKSNDEPYLNNDKAMIAK
jgi:hypothetical protein